MSSETGPTAFHEKALLEGASERMVTWTACVPVFLTTRVRLLTSPTPSVPKSSSKALSASCRPAD
jgi:hypothetical protein